MTVIAEIRFSPGSFELGRIFDGGDGESVELERIVPLGDSIVPYIWVDGDASPTFERRVQAHDSVDRFERHAIAGDRTLYELDWEADSDEVLQAVTATDGTILCGTGTEDGWLFELRFPNHAALSTFQERLMAADLIFDVEGIYDPSRSPRPRPGGITEPQLEALELAAARGYFKIPREVTTAELGAELGISDQAVTERLRRALDTLVEDSIVTERSLQIRE